MKFSPLPDLPPPQQQVGWKMGRFSPLSRGANSNIYRNDFAMVSFLFDASECEKRL